MKLPSYALGVAIAFVLQAALLGWIVADRALLLEHGKEVRLAVIPVDPHDLFRGDYVVLNYAASLMKSDIVPNDGAFNLGDTAYVSLAADGRPTAMAHKPPAGGTFLKGTVSDATEVTTCSSGATSCRSYRVDYNLEKFFVPEGTGRELETLRNDQKISVDIAVAGDGRAALKRLNVDGRPRFEEPPY
jgi:uncharacterized membrane-anchored protein